MKLSVVIPTLNRSDLLRLCVHSLLEQDFDKKEYEIIIVTDGPDENSNHLIASIKDQYNLPLIRIISLEEKKGPAAARNVGWKNASSELIAFTDDDTRPAKDWLKNFYEAHKEEGEIAYTGKVIVPLSKVPTDYEKNVANLETVDFVTANCMCTKSALGKVNGFDENFKIAWREDSDLHFKFLQSDIPIKFVEDAVVVHPVRNVNWGISIKEQKKSFYNALLYKKFPLLYKQKIMDSPLWNYYIMVLVFFIFMTFLFLKANSLAFVCLIGWIGLVLNFSFKRLKGTSNSFKHISEMLITSMIIPFLSIYWTLYGSWRYKVLFL